MERYGGENDGGVGVVMMRNRIMGKRWWRTSGKRSARWVGGDQRVPFLAPRREP